MKSKLVSITIRVFPVLFLALAAAVPAAAQEASSKPIVIPPVAYDTSPPLTDMVAAAPAEAPAGQRIIPLLFPPRPPAAPFTGEDPALQTLNLPLVGTTNGLNFAGTSADGVAPPDTNGSVGDNVTNQYVQIVNTEYAVYNKNSGALILGPTHIHNIWSGFSGDCSSGDGGDPNVLFDKAAKRWVVGQLNSGDNAYCMAVSTSDDATGSYARYEFSFGSNLPDYPKLGVWPDGYYFSANIFLSGILFTGADPCAFDRATMLNGGPANMICIQQGSSVASLLPSDLDGGTAPPAGEPNLYLELLDTSHLGLFKFHVDFSNPANSTFTGPTSITVVSYSEACGGGTCIPQPNGQQLDSLGDRLMFRNAYRNLSGTEYLVVNHSVTAGSTVGVRWYQIKNPNGTPTVAQQGTFAGPNGGDSQFRWMGSIGMDQAGDIAVGYSESSSTQHPSIYYTGRVPSDPANTMETESQILAGTGSQNGGLSRWGDYSGISIDPTDDCTFFYTTEYIPSDGSFNWHTQIASFKFTGCGGPPKPDFSLSATPPSQTVIRPGSTTYTVTVTPENGYTGTVNLTVSGCPSNTTCTLNPTSSGSPNYPKATLTVQTSKTTPLGTYTLTITGTDTANHLTHTTTVQLVVVIPDFSISASPASRSVRRGNSTTYAVTATPSNGFAGSVTFSVSGSPANTSHTFTPPSVTLPPAGNSTLTESTTKQTPTGTLTLTITGTSGSLVHSTTVTLTVTSH
jgi:hypothetical protein